MITANTYQTHRRNERMEVSMLLRARSSVTQRDLRTAPAIALSGTRCDRSLLLDRRVVPMA